MVMDVGSEFDDARKVRFLEWLTTPEGERRPQQVKELAAELDVTDRTLRNWRCDAKFRAVWEKRSKDVIGDPARVERILLEIERGIFDREESLASRTRAAELFMKAVDGIRPAKVDEAKRAAAELSTAELEALVAEQAQLELARRVPKPTPQAAASEPF